ncbi:uncharacterized protein M6B38_337340 [Iris pallida]|uniref:Uncharacterized protein n=1 Tax=Iris pallida TaxID=29817 RepID=A0AAX6GZ97_IRIPA|nr:uncharacterized protein M6B38_337340 [Iris pallida]
MRLGPARQLAWVQRRVAPQWSAAPDGGTKASMAATKGFDQRKGRLRTAGRRTRRWEGWSARGGHLKKGGGFPSAGGGLRAWLGISAEVRFFLLFFF